MHYSQSTFDLVTLIQMTQYLRKELPGTHLIQGCTVRSILSIRILEKYAVHHVLHTFKPWRLKCNFGKNGTQGLCFGMKHIKLALQNVFSSIIE